jgi:diguanylate cyclase (GGDEF)-like protein
MGAMLPSAGNVAPRRGVEKMRAQLRRLGQLAVVELEERPLAGRIAGVLFLLGGITLATICLLPGVTHAHVAVLLAIAAVSGGFGAGALWVIDWLRAPSWTIPLASVAGLIAVALAETCSGGAVSPVWTDLFFVAVFAAYFYRRPLAIAYLVGCVVTQSLPLLYDARALHDQFLARLAVGAPAYIGLGCAMMYSKALLRRLRSRAEQLAAEQGSLRRVATAVVDGSSTEEIYALVSREAAALLGGGAAGLLRFDSQREATVMGSWADHPGGRYEPGTVVPVRPDSDIERVLQTLEPQRVDDHPENSPVRRLGYSSSIVTPIRVDCRVWGVLAVSSRDVLTSYDERRLSEFAELLSTVVTSIEDRAKLAAQASTDPLTGLANHRTLQQRLGEEVARAGRHGLPLSVAVLDIDHFKQINDVGGHEAGDEMLVRVAGLLSQLTRAEDTLGRIGGDEFAWVLPEATREQALVAVERARRAIAADAPSPYRITVSAGICDTSFTSDPAQLLHLADGALYWSKAHGRNQCWLYDPEVIEEMSAQERAERLERSQTLVGLRVLASAIDAKDPATREHSERVSALAGRLARAAGWPAARVSMLEEAALVHDVGKIGVPDAILRSPGPLTAEERELLNGHAELASRILDRVLAAEQVEWVRSHQERPDGGGYPRGLLAHELSDGGALLALADAWDVLTTSPADGEPRSAAEALAECISLAGQRFTHEAIAALRQLAQDGALDLPALGPVA